jgi:uncharacterized protein (DUF433 family)
MDAQLTQRVCMHTGVMTGQPVIKGTRIPVEKILRMQAQGTSEDEIMKEYPRLHRGDIRADKLSMGLLGEKPKVHNLVALATRSLLTVPEQHRTLINELNTMT